VDGQQECMMADGSFIKTALAKVYIDSPRLACITILAIGSIWPTAEYITLSRVLVIAVHELFLLPY
jgi:hypothetical protein